MRVAAASTHINTTKAQHQHASWLAVATVCTDDQARWAPEMLHYGVESVPCFVLLKPGGESLLLCGAAAAAALR